MEQRYLLAMTVQMRGDVGVVHKDYRRMEAHDHTILSVQWDMLDRANNLTTVITYRANTKDVNVFKIVEDLIKITANFKDDIILIGYPVCQPYYAIAMMLAMMLAMIRDEDDTCGRDMYQLWHRIPMSCVKQDSALIHAADINQLYNHFYTDSVPADTNTMLVECIRALDTDPSHGFWVNYTLDKEDEEEAVATPKSDYSALIAAIYRVSMSIVAASFVSVLFYMSR